MIYVGDCLQVMPTLDENSVDSIITDPPYHLASIVKRFGKSFEEDENYAEDTKKVNPYARLAKSGFMGKEWDSDIAFRVEVWQAALRVAKPGAILMAFGGTRTWHRLACAIEDAGWEIRDTMMWLYGSGFPKSLDISKAIDKAAGAEREVVGPKPWKNQDIRNGHGRAYGSGLYAGEQTGHEQLMNTAPTTPAAHLWQGYGTALKPAWEPIIVAMKPLEGTYAENAQKWGVAGLNIDGGRIGTEPTLRTNGKTAIWSDGGMNSEQGGSTSGRWPANLLLDEEAARLLDEQSGESVSKPRMPTAHAYQAGVTPFQRGSETSEHCDHGGASRFFYTAKASSSERNAGLEDSEAKRDADRVRDDGIGGDNPRNRSNTPKLNFHPTVKPVDLMRYLCKLTKTPTGGVVLDPFMGSGTTGIAALLEHRDFIGIELNAEYAEIARKRIADMEGPLFQMAVTE